MTPPDTRLASLYVREALSLSSSRAGGATQNRKSVL